MRGSRLSGCPDGWDTLEPGPVADFGQRRGAGRFGWGTGRRGGTGLNLAMVILLLSSGGMVVRIAFSVSRSHYRRGSGRLGSGLRGAGRRGGIGWNLAIVIIS